MLDMRHTCDHVRRMSRMIQIRNVPDQLHRELKARSAQAGMTLSDYLLDVVRKAVERPDPEVLRARLRERAPVYPSQSPADAVRAERDAR
jgi:antitoxin FitA